MSAKLVTAALACRAPLQTVDCILLVIIANHCNAKKDDGVAWPSVQTMARMARVGERHVRRSIAKLIEMKLLEVVGERHGGRTAAGIGLTTKYRICLDALRNPATEDRANPATEDRVNNDAYPDMEGTEPGHAEQETLSPMAAKQVLNLERMGKAGFETSRNMETDKRRALKGLAELAAKLNATPNNR